MLLEEGVCSDQCVLLAKHCYILCSEAKLACYYRYLLISYFCIPVPYGEKDIFFGVLLLEGLVGLHRPFNFSFFSVSGWGTDLDYCDVEWFALETNQDHSVVFEIAPKYCISDSFVDCEGYSIFFLRDSCQQ